MMWSGAEEKGNGEVYPDPFSLLALPGDVSKATGVAKSKARVIHDGLIDVAFQP